LPAATLSIAPRLFSVSKMASRCGRPSWGMFTRESSASLLLRKVNQNVRCEQNVYGGDAQDGWVAERFVIFES
jgi:hypothetical protein